MKPHEAHHLLIEVGYELETTTGGAHRRYRHPGMPGFVTLPWHDHGRDLPNQKERFLRKQLKLAKEKQRD